MVKKLQNNSSGSSIQPHKSCNAGLLYKLRYNAISVQRHDNDDTSPFRIQTQFFRLVSYHFLSYHSVQYSSAFSHSLAWTRSNSRWRRRWYNCVKYCRSRRREPTRRRLRQRSTTSRHCASEDRRDGAPGRPAMRHLQATSRLARMRQQNTRTVSNSLVYMFITTAVDTRALLMLAVGVRRWHFI